MHYILNSAHTQAFLRSTALILLKNALHDMHTYAIDVPISVTKEKRVMSLTLMFTRCQKLSPDSFSPRGGYPQEALKSTLSAVFSASFRNAPLVAAYCNGAPPCENLLENPCPESKYFTVKILQLIWAFLRKICFLKLPVGIFPSPQKKEPNGFLFLW